MQKHSSQLEVIMKRKPSFSLNRRKSHSQDNLDSSI